ncbi:protein of unknown function [Cupriavidus taiwanensis]|uniref:Uncharacterized protein n=1 Tax=Cupriavidus taiwanensis TaxID=164546 RepID=A0A375DDG2_9BURK|nr:hypothetical protein CBM2585_A160299 [Cupriavidus taiwanensis]SOY89194.1 protein of unknown function [Cupriavidus taiwanensis]SOZ03244.1 hypothetical protein CBM2597_A110308 [Cupriavidus taiwanensis]SOZ06521.1 hypothetical protein CBM2595_A81206 [Cupriavidus taiwanensis]SPC11415.1 hypothetical protein CT19431_40114 [Cupriavidus taiwanensis]
MVNEIANYSYSQSRYVAFNTIAADGSFGFVILF